MSDINFVYIIEKADLKAAGMLIGPMFIAPAIVGMGYFLKDLFDSKKTIGEAVVTGVACNMVLSPLGLVIAGETSRDPKMKALVLLSAVSYAAVLGAIFTMNPIAIGAAACAVAIQVGLGAVTFNSYLEQSAARPPSYNEAVRYY